MRPLLQLEIERVKGGEQPWFQSHMWDGSGIDLEENLKIADELFAMSIEAHTILELEIGVVGGEEDGVSNEMNEKLYTSPKDMERVTEVLGAPGERGRYLLAAVFGNVHGVYKPGAVKLKPSILKEGQEHVGAKLGKKNPFDLVFHGGSGSLLEEIHETLGYGVIKMNIDTDTQYAFTRPIVDHVFKNYDGVLKIDGEVGNKKVYDPRSYGKSAEAGMAARVVQGCQDLKSAGQKLR
jgi:fructose-bisphosphate aldolase class II